MMIHILASTDRPNSMANKIAAYTAAWLEENTNSKAMAFSLEDYPAEDVTGGRYGNPSERVKSFNDRFLDADGHLFVVPELKGFVFLAYQTLLLGRMG